MILWTEKYLMKVIFGKGTSEESRLHNTLQLNSTQQDLLTSKPTKDSLIQSSNRCGQLTTRMG
jgi:hypothetical protein